MPDPTTTVSAAMLVASEPAPGQASVSIQRESVRSRTAFMVVSRGVLNGTNASFLPLFRLHLRRAQLGGRRSRVRLGGPGSNGGTIHSQSDFSSGKRYAG